MKRIFAPLLALALLAGCAGGTASLPEAVKDKLVCDNSERLCAYMAAAVVAELAVDRVVNREPADALPTLGRMQVLVRALDKFNADGGDWPATTAYQAGRSLVLALDPIVRSRVGSVLAGIATVTPSFVLAELYRGGLAGVVHKDIRTMVASKTEAQVIDIIRARIAENMKRIQAMGELA